jgi:hypothetical protein
MRRIFHLTMLGLAGGAVSACQPDIVVATENIPTAGVRFINAVPDTAGAFGLDLRFVDLTEDNAQFRITYRDGPSALAPFVATQIEFKNARVPADGKRNFRIFLDDTIQSLASSVLKDTVVTLAASTNYTAILWGNSRSAANAPDAMHLTFMTDTVADPAGQVALRVINATSAAIDVRQYVTGGAAAALAAPPTWPAVPAYSASKYVLVAPVVSTIVAPVSILYNVQPAGGGANLFVDAAAMPGVAATCSNLACKPGEQPDVIATPGATVAGSALSAIIFSPTPALARTPQGATFKVPAIAFMWDRRPPTGCAKTLC